LPAGISVGTQRINAVASAHSCIALVEEVIVAWITIKENAPVLASRPSRRKPLEGFS